MRILIVSEFITPVNAVAAIRWTKLGKYLNANHDCTIDVLTTQKSFQPEITAKSVYRYDETLAADKPYFNQFIEFKDSLQTRCINFTYNSLKHALKGKHSQTTQSATSKPAANKQKSDSPFIRYCWDAYTSLRDTPRAKQAYHAIEDFSQYDVIISSYGPKWVHLVGEMAKTAHPGLIWIADYRDSLVFSEHTDTKQNRLFPKQHTRNANLVTYVSPTFEDLMLPDGQPRLFLPNGYDDETAIQQDRKLTDKFYISITGTLYDDGTNASDLRPLFDILSELIQEGFVEAENIEVRHCGNRSDIFTAQASEFPQVPIKAHGFVPRSVAMEMQRSSSLLVLPVWNTKLSKGVISGRIYEYFASGVPIMGLCSGDLEGSSLKEMIEKSQTGFCYEEASRAQDLKGLQHFILSKYQEWKLHGITTRDTDWEYVKSYSYSSLARKIHETLMQLRQNES